MTDRLSVHLNGFLGLDHVVDQMESDWFIAGELVKATFNETAQH